MELNIHISMASSSYVPGKVGASQERGHFDWQTGLHIWVGGRRLQILPAPQTHLAACPAHITLTLSLDCIIICYRLNCVLFYTHGNLVLKFYFSILFLIADRVLLAKQTSECGRKRRGEGIFHQRCRRWEVSWKEEGKGERERIQLIFNTSECDCVWKWGL